MTTSRLALALALASIGAAGCAPLPTLTFQSDDATAPHDDATAPAPSSDAGGEGSSSNGGGGDDAASGDDGSFPVDDPGTMDASGDDGGGGAIACGGDSVGNCAQCPGAPLHCKAKGRNECVASCDQCGAGWLPCWHCAGKSPVRGTCLPFDGGLACTGQTRCSCTTASDCPASANAAETCIGDPQGGGRACFTCGESSTSGAACAIGGGGSGTCAVGASGPACN